MNEACRSCGAHVIWVLTKAGKGMPLDAKPSAAGNLVLEFPDDPRDAPSVRPVKPGDLSEGLARYTSHFATCPQAAQWRKA
jgi:hypothetical protein